MESQRQECLGNLKSVANLGICQKVANYGNAKLGHVWDFTPDEVLKVLEALILYCIDEGKEPKSKKLRDIGLRRLEWFQAGSGVRMDTWCT